VPAILVDTNILVYAHDRGEHAKQAQAIKVLKHLYLTGNGRLSVQSLGEFFSIITRGPTPRLSSGVAAEQVERMAQTWPILDITPMIVLEAVRGVRERRLAYWDAQLWATARLNQIPVIFTEDFSPGAGLDGVRFVNPLVAGFVVESWR
jgi:predicted nucleic acid-binding protein